DSVALVGGCGVLVVVTQAEGRDAAASRSQGVVAILGGYRVVVKQAQAEQTTGGTAELESVTVVTRAVVIAGGGTGTDDPATTQTKHRGISVRLPVVFDRGVVLGDVQQVRLNDVDLGHRTPRVIRPMRIVDLVAIGSVFAVDDLALVSVPRVT